MKGNNNFSSTRGLTGLEPVGSARRRVEGVLPEIRFLMGGCRLLYGWLGVVFYGGERLEGGRGELR